MIILRAASYLALGLLGFGLTTPLAAQEASGDAPSARDRITDVKAQLLDETPGFYASPTLSASAFAGDFDVAGQEVDFDGYFVRAGGSGGYQLQNIRVELNATLGKAELDLSLPGALVGVLDDEESVFFVTVVASAFYDFDVRLDQLISARFPAAGRYLPATRPYIGGGSGLIYLDFDEIDDDDVAYLANAVAGLGIRISPRVHLDVGYRFFYIPRTEPGGLDLEITSHSADFKLRYRF